jgi:alkylhydroperoxidase family enzyme
MVVSEHVRDQSTLPPFLRELAIVTVAHCVDDRYELHQHEPIARTLGVTDAQLADLENWQHSPAYSELERAVIAFAWQATAARRVDNPTAEKIIKLLPRDQVVELAFTVGWYHLCHVIVDSLGVEIE